MSHWWSQYLLWLVVFCVLGAFLSLLAWITRLDGERAKARAGALICAIVVVALVAAHQYTSAAHKAVAVVVVVVVVAFVWFFGPALIADLNRQHEPARQEDEVPHKPPTYV